MSRQPSDHERVESSASPGASSGGAAAGIGGDLPASLLKRVAEAAAGLSNGRRVWFAVERAFPHQLEAFHDEGQADAALARSPDSHVKVGPCLTPNERAGRKRIEWIKVKVEGREAPVEFDPERVDALFFSNSALDKFLYPYYTALYGPTEAAKIYERYDDAVVVCHEPISEPCKGGSGGGSEP